MDYQFTSDVIINIAIVIGCLLVSMTVHEFMHAYVGYRLGDTTAMQMGRISFNPLKHIDPIMTIALPAITLLFFHFPFLAAKPVPFDPARVKFNEYGAALLALAGPLSNIALAFIGAFILRFTHTGLLTSQIIVYFVELNVILAVFNLIPIPPLDGSRVLYAFAPEVVQDFMMRIEPYGLFIIILLVVSGSGSNVLTYLDNLVLGWLP